jgi:predicted nucleic acid-binding protein
MPLQIPPSKFLCDTNILSELARREPNRGVLAWAEGVTSVAISVVCVEEILYGLTWRPNARIQHWFDDFLLRQCRIMPVTEQIARVCGSLRGELRSKGNARSQADMLIAATARVHDLTLVTRNARDFEDCRISLLNPFSSR